MFARECGCLTRKASAPRGYHHSTSPKKAGTIERPKCECQTSKAESAKRGLFEFETFRLICKAHQLQRLSVILALAYVRLSLLVKGQGPHAIRPRGENIQNGEVSILLLEKVFCQPRLKR